MTESLRSNRLTPDESETLYCGISGGRELISWFGCIPSFHDGEIISLSLHRRTTSLLTIFWSGPFIPSGKNSESVERSAVVTFFLKDIIYLELEGFSHQNVIGELQICRSMPDLEKRRYYSGGFDNNDYEIRIDSIFGLGGIIRCSGITIRSDRDRVNER